MIKKSGTAKWTGDLKDGGGEISTQSGALTAQPYGFNTRFEDKSGTNPEELIAAAHASCFSMAFANMLSGAEITGVAIETQCVIVMDKTAAGFSILKSELTCTVKADADEDDIREVAEAAKEGCPVSQLLNCEITLDLSVA
ncbi:OsmC family protein [Albirhodobacter sp. R86504]|uniref:OsmC family protein n=1 Tax=Albirhodobacter sp. R86504 TaxID=3093848 RepID=UPI00366CCBFF